MGFPPEFMYFFIPRSGISVTKVPSHSKIVPLGLDFTNKSDARSIGDYSFGGEGFSGGEGDCSSLLKRE